MVSQMELEATTDRKSAHLWVTTQFLMGYRLVLPGSCKAFWDVTQPMKWVACLLVPRIHWRKT